MYEGPRQRSYDLADAVPASRQASLTLHSTQRSDDHAPPTDSILLTLRTNLLENDCNSLLTSY